MSCDFTSAGIKNDTTRNIIEEIIWNLGGWNISSIYPNEIYGYERGIKVYSGRSTTWKGKIALMYPSDYGYAADLTKCKSSTEQDAIDLNLGQYNSDVADYQCSANDWLLNAMSQRLLTPDFSDDRRMWTIGYAGSASMNSSYISLNLRPVLYLSYKLEIDSGEGTSTDPYRLIVK